MLLTTPLDQFISLILFNFQIFNLNTTLLFFFLLAIIFVCSSFSNVNYFISTGLQQFFEKLYTFINTLLVEQSTKKGDVFFVFVNTLFIFILLANYIGMLPMGFTLTSHIIVTLSLGLSIIIGLTIIGLLYQGVSFVNLFIPKDVSILMMPLLIIIEIVSYISRGFSLSIRLFANLMAGHTLLNILSSFIFMLVKVNKLLMIITFLVVFAIVILELALAFLQAYVFSVLTCIYLNDSVSGASH